MKIKLVVGLGNIGKKYDKTRHNAGFMVIDKIAQDLGITKWKKRDDALFFDAYINFSKVIFLKPQKYMNLSGDVIIKFINFFDINIEDIIIICDDLNLPIGTIKLKLKGSSGGHNGLKNIEANLSSNEYKRIKIGISKSLNKDIKDYVLGKFSAEELKKIDYSTTLAKQAVFDSLNNSFEKIMSKYNLKIKQGD